MLDVLQFIFRDFWTFWGTVILLYMIEAYGVAAIACIFQHSDSNDKEKEDDKENYI